jgi:hypothetical protein
MKTDTVTVYGIEVEVNYEYYKGEPSTRDYPGSSPEVSILKVFAGSDTDIYDLLSGVVIDKIEEILIELNN